MYRVILSKAFKKAFKRCVKRGLDVAEFEVVVNLLKNNGSLPPCYKPHKLSSKFKFAWECHIQPDWLLIWQQDDEALTLLLIDTGSHSDIFG